MKTIKKASVSKAKSGTSLGMKVMKAQGGKMIVPHEATHGKEPNEPFKQKGTFTSPKFKNKMDSVIQTNKQMFGDKKASTKFEALKKGGKVKKAQGGKLQPMGNATKVGEGKYKSEDGNYKMKFKGGSEGSAPTKIVQRRTIKGLLSGAPRGAGNLNMKKGGKMGKCKYGCK